MSRLLPSDLPSLATALDWTDPAARDALRADGLLPLALDALARRGWTDIPVTLRERFQEERASAAAAELSAAGLRRVLDALAAHGVRVIVIKGGALAYTHYPRPDLRPRLDTDLLIDERDIAATHAVFRALGGAYLPHVTGRYVMSQFHYGIADGAGCTRTYDVHWRVVNPVVFAAALTFEEISRGAVPVPALGKHGFAPQTLHAMLLAALHRAAHHREAGPAIWLHDLRLLAASLDAGGRSALVREASARGLGRILGRALAEVAEAYHAADVEALAGACTAAAESAGDRYVSRGTRASAALDELRSLPNHRERLRLLGEWICPPRDYMRATYARGSSLPLPLLYLSRLCAGGAAWLRRSGPH